MPMKYSLLTIAAFVVAAIMQAQAPKQAFTDPLELLQAVARNYAAATDTFRIESIADNLNTGELQNSWNRTYRIAIQGPGKLYRIEARTSTGSYVQVSDGTYQWLYQVESNHYEKRPVPENWPEFPKVMDMGLMELKQAWTVRTWLEDEALEYKRATMLPEETIIIEGHRYPCYVVRVSSADSIAHRKEYGSSDETFWVDKDALVFRKTRRITDGSATVSNNLHIPWHGEETNEYPVVELSAQTSPEMFRFTPPDGATEVASVAPQWGGTPPAEHPKAQMMGEMAPEVMFDGPDGKKIALSSFRGKPVLIDLWATWCGPCILSMPVVDEIYTKTKEMGLVIVSVDQNEGPLDGAVYFARHHYGWANYHDTGKAVLKAFKSDGIPLMVLVDAQGKTVYYDFGSNEEGLRKAIAGLGPEYAAAMRQGTAPAPTIKTAAPQPGVSQLWGLGMLPDLCAGGPGY
jgi:thiol-disulfide isomerase/thioredoxin/outer membrane lipoprotein-sorting protein